VDASSRTLRYAGLAGAVLLAVAGARSGQREIAQPTWFAGTVLLSGAWLLLGRRLTGVPLRWLVVTAVLWALPVLVSLPLASRDVYAYACQGSLVAHGVDPYLHGAASLPCPWLSEMPHVWQGTTSPYGPLWLAVSGLAALAGNLGVAVGILKLVAVGGVALAAAAGYRLARAVGCGSPQETNTVPATWLFLLCPVVLVHAASGAHNDALLAGLVVAAFAVALTAPDRYRAPGAGVLIGLAFAVKATAIVALPFLVLLLVADRRWWSLLRAGAITALGAVGAYGVVWALTGYGLGWLSALPDTTKHIQEWTSVPTGLGLGAGRLLRELGRPGHTGDMVRAFRALGLLVLAVALIVLWFWARRRTRPADVVVAAGVALLAAVVLAPVAFPWYALVPVALLAYGLTDARWRYRLALVLAPVPLLILPNGNGIGAKYPTTGALVDALIVSAALVIGVRYLLRRRARVP
jgi:hypothetical protein